MGGLIIVTQREESIDKVRSVVLGEATVPEPRKENLAERL